MTSSDISIVGLGGLDIVFGAAPFRGILKGVLKGVLKGFFNDIAEVYSLVTCNCNNQLLGPSKLINIHSPNIAGSARSVLTFLEGPSRWLCV